MISPHDMQQLSAELDALGRGPQGEYVVDRVLKEAPGSRTELVHDSAAPSVRLVRKTFDAEAGLGGAYGTVMRAQRRGFAVRHLPRLYEYVEAGGRATVVMEHVEGETLAQLVERKGPSTQLAARIMPDLCDAAAELHDLPGGPVIHRDIKPSNVIVSEDRLVLIDLGIARVYREGAERDTVRFGTPGFAPPEQFGYGQTSRASDIYALGGVLWFCLTGAVPTAQDRERAFHDVRVPEAARRVIVQATSFDPARRFASAQEMRAAVKDALGAAGRSDGGSGAAGPAPLHDSDRAGKDEEPPLVWQAPGRGHGRAGSGNDDRGRDADSGRIPSAEAGSGRGSGGNAQSAAQQLSNASSRIAGALDRARATLITRLGKPLLIAWDAAVVLVWALCWYVAVYNIVWPVPADQGLPFWLLVFEYAGILGAGGMLVLFPFLYKPRLRKRWPRLERTPWLKQLLICWGGAVLLVLAVTAAYAASGTPVPAAA